MILGVDPGITGAIAFYDPGHSPGPANTADPAAVFDMPVHRALRGKTAMDVDAFKLMGLVAIYAPTHAFVEQVTSRPRQGGQFAFGVNLGRILGALESADIPITHVSSSRWKPAMGLRGADKAMSVKLAAELFPSLKRQLYGKRGAGLDGRAESLLIAWYGAKHAS